MITVYEEQRNGAIANTIEHTYASLETCLEIIRRMDGFIRSQVTIRYKEYMIMNGATVMGKETTYERCVDGEIKDFSSSGR